MNKIDDQPKIDVNRRMFCFTSYVMVTPKGNPANISVIRDLAKPGTKVILEPEASPPGGNGQITEKSRTICGSDAPLQEVSIRCGGVA